MQSLIIYERLNGFLIRLRYASGVYSIPGHLGPGRLRARPIVETCSSYRFFVVVNARIPFILTMNNNSNVVI